MRLVFLFSFLYTIVSQDQSSVSQRTKQVSKILNLNS